jgi:hypothetical protein
MAVDPLLISHTDLQSIKGNLSLNVEADQIDPYIQEAQMQELRRFLGDELYLELLNGYDKDVVGDNKGIFEFKVSDEGFSAAAGLPVYEIGKGWKVPSTDTSSTIQNLTTINLDLSKLGTNTSVFIALTIETEATGINAIINISPGFSGPFTTSLVMNGSGRYTSASQTMTADSTSIDITLFGGGWSDDIYITKLEVISEPDNKFTDPKFNRLMRGEEYTNTRGQLVKFNGLEEALKHWTYSRYLSESDLLSLRYGNRVAEDGIFSAAAFRDKVKASAYHHKSMALSRQRDAYNYLSANKDIYPSWLTSTRIPKRKSFEINKIPKDNGNSYYLR